MTSAFKAIVIVFLSAKAYANVRCGDLFDNLGPKIAYAFNNSNKGATLTPEAGLVTLGFHEGFSSTSIQWSSNAAAVFNTPQRLRPNPEMTGPYRYAHISPFTGPRMLVSTKHPGAQFSAGIKVNGELYQARFTINRNPTFIGLRAIDFKNANQEALAGWPDLVEEFQIVPHRLSGGDLTLYGEITMAFNPTLKDLARPTAEGGPPWIQYLLRNQLSKTGPRINESDITDFVKIYENMNRLESIQFAKSLERQGVASIRAYLKPLGFDTKPLMVGGQLSMKDFLSQFKEANSNLIFIPVERGFFGEAHGSLSHVLQICSLLYGLTHEQANVVYRVLKQVTSTDNKHLWMAWSGLFNSFAGDAPSSTAWWPNHVIRQSNFILFF